MTGFKKFLYGLGDAAVLFGKTISVIFRGKIEYDIVLKQIIKIGNESVALVVLCGFFTGMVLALQTGETFVSIFNEPLYVGLVVSYSMVLELGPVLTAIVVTGRAASAMAAEIGTMKVTEQIDALYTLGTEPVSFIFVPRFIAFVVALPVLTIFSDVAGILGGLLVSIAKLQIPFSKYWDEVRILDVSDMVHGLIKSGFFAFIIVWVACYNGMKTSGGAEGVGKSTTRAVVVAMVLILVLDYFITSFLISMGIG
ncbi:MAG: ABC transporter permease [Elusimicrobia bacterium]|nr:ABC transporter permease [Elusimicrobiota bacterium]